MVDILKTYVNILASVIACYMIFVDNDMTKLNVDARFFMGFAITAVVVVVVKRIYGYIYPKLMTKMDKLFEDETEELA